MRAILCTTDRDVADEVDEPDEPRLVQLAAGVLLGEHTFSKGLSPSMPAIPSAMRWAMMDCLAWAFRCDQRASRGTQKILSALYSSGGSGSAPWSFSASNISCCGSKTWDSKTREMYL
jgi:hypothetical protein